MHNKSASYILRVLLLGMITIMTFVSCQFGKGGSAYDPAKDSILLKEAQEALIADSINRAKVDSVVYKNTRNRDRLIALVDSFKADSNYYGISVAARNLGGEYRNKSEYNKSHEVLRLSLKYATLLQDTLELMQTYNYIATTFRRQGVLDSASTFHYEALKLSNAYSQSDTYNGQKNRAVTINGLGNIYLMYKNYQKADSLFHISLQCERNINSLRGQALNYAQIGNVKADNGELDSAMIYYEDAIAMNRAEGNKQGIAISLNQIGTLLKDLGRTEEAIDTLKESYRLLEELGDRQQWMRPCMALSSIYMEKGQYDTAQYYLDAALKVSREVNSSKNLGHIQFLRADLFKRQGQWHEAFLSLESGCAYEDSLRSEKNQYTTYMMEKKIEEQIKEDSVNRYKAMKEAEIQHEKENTEHAREALNQWLSIGGIVVMLLVLSALIGFLIVRQRQLVRLKLEMEATDQARREALEAKAQAEAASNMKTAFMQSISHELRTPLNGIQGFTDILAEQGEYISEEERTMCTDLIHKNTQDLTTLVNNMIEFAELESGTLKVEPSIISLADAFDNILDSLQKLRKDEVEVRLGPNITQDTIVQTDTHLFSKVLENYMSNAMKYTSAGSVVVDLEVEGDLQRLTVTDSGMGIAAENAEKVFDRFEKLGSFVQGNGLGLTLVRMIADRLNGRAYLDTSYADGGARFVFECPKLSME